MLANTRRDRSTRMDGTIITLHVLRTAQDGTVRAAGVAVIPRVVRGIGKVAAAVDRTAVDSAHAL
jgi:hypothetical protein